VGNGTSSSKLQNTVSLPEHIKVGTSMQSLINTVYPNIKLGIPSDEYLRDRMILSARNEDVQDINCAVLDIFSGNKRTYLSADDSVVEKGADNNN
ncbi:17076_t:CDS:1, partial [Cetraspora pellucida]